MPGVATELLHGLARVGHRVDCFLPGAGREAPERLAAEERLTFVWGTSRWRWNRWYSRTAPARFVSGLLARGVASLRIRCVLARGPRGSA